MTAADPTPPTNLMSDEWIEVPCLIADILRHDGSVRVTASKTDLGGTYGEPEIYTEWSWRGEEEDPVLREWRFPDARAVDHPRDRVEYPDVKPCRHEVPKRRADS